MLDFELIRNAVEYGWKGHYVNPELWGRKDVLI